IDDDGYVWFLGRRDDLINSFGYRVSPHEVERVLKSHPEIADAAAAGETVGAEKTLVVAYVVPRSSSLTAHAVLSWAHEHLASYTARALVARVAERPGTRNGRGRRGALRRGRSGARASA